MKIEGYVRDMHSIQQLMYKNTIEVLSQFLQQNKQPIQEINIIVLQQRVGGKISQLNETSKTKQDENLIVISSPRQKISGPKLKREREDDL